MSSKELNVICWGRTGLRRERLKDLARSASLVRMDPNSILLLSHIRFIWSMIQNPRLTGFCCIMHSKKSISAFVNLLVELSFHV